MFRRTDSEKSARTPRLGHECSKWSQTNSASLQMAVRPMPIVMTDHVITSQVVMLGGLCDSWETTERRSGC